VKNFSKGALAAMWANSCGNYYALIDGEPYAVRVNPNYDRLAPAGVQFKNTHYVKYNNLDYYFSL
ncbi:MAG: hypothetical protein IJR34_03210, partial [Bacteroidales bacterium]|nr:hypothetical protein [Bacteroidales bacterium]